MIIVYNILNYTYFKPIRIYETLRIDRLYFFQIIIASSVMVNQKLAFVLNWLLALFINTERPTQLL